MGKMIDAVQAKKYAEEITSMAASRSVLDESLKHSAKVDTIILPGDRMIELHDVAEWLRFNGLVVVFTNASMSASARMTPDVVAVGRNSISDFPTVIGSKPSHAFNVAFASSQGRHGRR